MCGARETLPNEQEHNRFKVINERKEQSSLETHLLVKHVGDCHISQLEGKETELVE